MTALVTKHLPLVAGAPDGIKKLRELVLELAVRGKLVSQDRKDEAANLLLERVAVEKDGLAKLGKIKKQKHPLKALQTGPFELPASWLWIRLGDIAAKITDGTHHSPTNTATGDFKYISAKNIKPWGIDLSEVTYVTAEVHEEIFARCDPALGDVLYIKDGATTGIATINTMDEPFSMLSSVALIKPSCGILNAYLLKAMTAPSFYREMRAGMTGVAITRVTLAKLNEALIPLPPLAEQHRIVAKVDELMALCDRLEADQADAEAAHAQLVLALLDSLTQATDAADFRASWQRLSEHVHTLFTTEASIDALKQTVLQLAVMGRLVPQIQRDGNAMDLLASIAKMGKSKAPVTSVVDENLPAVPPSWCWVRIADMAHVGTGATPSRTNPAYFDPPKISWVTSGETSQPFVQSTEQKVSPLALNETNLTVYPVGTLVVAMYGQGKTRGQVTELLIEACTNQACAAIQLTCDDSAHRKFVKYFFEKSYDELRSLAAGGAQPNLNLGKIKETLIPLPPLAEQHRIVAKVDELMALCDQLKAQLAEARKQHAQLATALVEQAVD